MAPANTYRHFKPKTKRILKRIKQQTTKLPKSGCFDEVPATDVRRWEKEFLDFLRTKHAAVMQRLEADQAIKDDTKKSLAAALKEFGSVFQPTKQ